MKRLKLGLKAVKCLNERSGVVDMAQRLTHGLFCSQLKLSAQPQRSLGSVVIVRYVNKLTARAPRMSEDDSLRELSATGRLAVHSRAEAIPEAPYSRARVRRR